MPAEADDDNLPRLDVPRELRANMRLIARDLRNHATPTEQILWQAIRNKQLEGRRFRRQVAIGAFVVDFYCPEERLAVEVDGRIHEKQRESDEYRQQAIEALGIRFVRVTTEQVEQQMPQVLEKIRSAFRAS